MRFHFIPTRGSVRRSILLCSSGVELVSAWPFDPGPCRACSHHLPRKHQDKYNVYFLTEFLGGGDLFYAIRAIGVGDSCPLLLHQPELLHIKGNNGK